MSDTQLRTEFQKADKRLGLLQTFENLREASSQGIKFRKNILLIFKFNVPDGENTLEMRSFKNVNRAIEAYDELEKELGKKADIVLVRGESEENIRAAFRNYFSDAKAFVDLVQQGIKEL